jgi:hypothetical protein
MYRESEAMKEHRRVLATLVDGVNRRPFVGNSNKIRRAYHESLDMELHAEDMGGPANEPSSASPELKQDWRPPRPDGSRYCKLVHQA